MATTRLKGSTGERLLSVLEALIQAERSVSLPELTDATGLPKPTVHRLINVLEDAGYAIKDPEERRLLPGPVMHRLALSLLQARPLLAARHAILKELADTVGEACNLVLLDGTELTYIDRVDTAWPLRLRFEIGSHVPVHCTAAGKLLLALQPKRIRDRLIRTMPLEAHTARSITDPDDLEAVFKAIREERVGTDDQEFLPEMVAVAVPIDVPKGSPIAAVSIHAPIFRRSLDDLRAFIPQLKDTAKAVSKVLYE